MLDRIVLWLLKKDSPVSWLEYRLDKFFQRGPYDGIKDYNNVSGIIAENLHEITDKLGLRKRY